MDPRPFFSDRRIADTALQTIWCLAALTLWQAPTRNEDLVDRGIIFCLGSPAISAWNIHPTMAGPCSSTVFRSLRDDRSPDFLPQGAMAALELVPRFLPAHPARAALYLCALSYLRCQNASDDPLPAGWALSRVLEAYEYRPVTVSDKVDDGSDNNLSKVATVVAITKNRLARIALPPQLPGGGR